MFQFATLNDIKVNASNSVQVLQELEILLKSGRHHYICFFEGNLLYRALTDDNVRNVINSATLVYPDGIAVAKCWSWHFHYPFWRVSGPSIMLKVCEYGIKKHWRHFLLGGSVGTPERMAHNLKQQFPEVEIVGYYSPPFRPMTEKEEKELVSKINETKPDFLWVGLGGPKQEFWMHEHLNKLNVPIMLGVGAAFDFHSGNRPWAPKWIRRIGLEWLFRALSGGRKTFWRNVKCVSFVSLLLMKEFLLSHLFYQKHRINEIEK